MFDRSIKCSLVFAVTGLMLLPLSVQGQAGAGGAGRPAAASELGAAEIAARIQAVQQQAMRDPELAAGNREIGALIAATLPRVDAEFPTYVTRATTLRAEVAAARAAEDNEKLVELAAETEQLQSRITEAQEKARAHSAVKEKLDDFKVRLFTKMVEIDPSVQELVNDLARLHAEEAARGS